MAKKAHTLVGGRQEDITLYSTLGEVQNTGMRLIVDGVACYAKYGAVGDGAASKAKLLIGGVNYALLKSAKLSYGYTEYKSPGSFVFSAPAGCSRVRITACAAGGGGGYTISYGGVSSAPVTYYGGFGGDGASVNARLVNVSSGAPYGVIIGAGGGEAVNGGDTRFGTLLALSGGGRGSNAYYERLGGGNSAPTYIPHSGSSGADRTPHEITIPGYGAGGSRGPQGTHDSNGSPGQNGYMKIEWGGDIEA